ncbi:carboxyl transferase domain-containing protein [Sphingomonas sp. MMS24-JH45]
MGQKRIEAQHAKGKLTARERLDVLLDEGSFEELDMFVEHNCTDFGMEAQVFPGDGVVTGSGTINGRPGVRLQPGLHRFRRLAVGAARTEDLEDNGHGDEGRRAGHRPRHRRCAHPGGRGVAGRLCQVFQRNVLRSPCASSASSWGRALAARADSPAMTDFIFMVKDFSYMFVTGPDAVKTVTNEVVTQEALGGAITHTTKTSVADVAFDDDIETLLAARDFIDFLPLSSPGGARAAGSPTRGTARRRASTR